MVNAMRDAGKSIIDLTETNPTTCGFVAAPQDLLSPPTLQSSQRYEPDPKGILQARRALAGWYENQNLNIDPSAVILTSGTSEAYSFIFRLLCNPSDSIAVPKPGYPLFEFLADLNDVACRQYRLVYDGEWRIDWPSLEAAVAEDTRALIVVHPGNPTGGFIKTDDAERLLGFLGERGIALIADEVFGSFAFDADSRRHGSFARTGEILTFTLNGLSKFAALPQMKLSWIVVSGPAALRTEACKRLEIIADTFLSVNTPVQHELTHLLKRGSSTAAHILDRVRKNYSMLRQSFSPPVPASVFSCEGGWSALCRLPSVRSDVEWAMRFLGERGVLVHPGQLFDCDIPSCIVVSLLPEPAVFAEGIQNLMRELRG